MRKMQKNTQNKKENMQQYVINNAKYAKRILTEKYTRTHVEYVQYV